MTVAGMVATVSGRSACVVACQMAVLLVSCRECVNGKSRRKYDQWRQSWMCCVGCCVWVVMGRSCGLCAGFGTPGSPRQSQEMSVECEKCRWIGMYCDVLCLIVTEQLRALTVL